MQLGRISLAMSYSQVPCSCRSSNGSPVASLKPSSKMILTGAIAYGRVIWLSISVEDGYHSEVWQSVE